MNEKFQESFPKLIYKFREFDKAFHLKTLTHDSLYLAKQSELNDPLDTLLPFSYKKHQMSTENIKRKLLETGRSRWPEKTEKELKDFARIRMEEVDFQSDEYWINMIPTFQKMVNEKIGILSLSERWDSYSLWAHYGNSHKGFCLGFNTEKLYQSIGGLIGKVDYSNESNEVDLFDDSHHGLAKSILQKSTDFDFESENRITKYGFAGKPILYPTGCLEKVIMGAKIIEKDKLDLLRILKSFHPLTKLYQARIDPVTRTLVKDRIL